MDAASTSETSVNFYKTECRNIPEGSHLPSLEDDTRSPNHKIPRILWDLKNHSQKARHWTLSTHS
jgi:hypothetical protein